MLFVLVLDLQVMSLTGVLQVSLTDHPLGQSEILSQVYRACQSLWTSAGNDSLLLLGHPAKTRKAVYLL